MGCSLDEEISRSKGDKEIETARARQAHYIKWSQVMNMPDPCGPDLGYQRVLAIYGKYVIHGANCTNKEFTRSKTLEGYFKAVNFLFEKRGFPAPVEFDNPQNVATMILNNLTSEEDVARRRSSITTPMYAEIIAQGERAEAGSKPWLLAKLASISKVVGPRACEYAQKTQQRIEVHRYPSGRKEVTKAWTRLDFLFLGKRDLRLDPLKKEWTRKRVVKVVITWRIQKNRQNGQKLTVVRDLQHPALCPVLAALDLYNHSHDIGQKDEEPMFALVDARGRKKYWTAGRVAICLQAVAKKVHPDLPQEDIKKFTCHSFRVWACALLSEAGKSSDFIKDRLRWLGDSYRMYLRDTSAINQQHNDALDPASKEVMAALAGNDSDELRPEEISQDESMGSYEDII